MVTATRGGDNSEGEWEFPIRLKEGVSWREVLPLEDETPVEAFDLMRALDEGLLELWGNERVVRLYNLEGDMVLEIATDTFGDCIHMDRRGKRRPPPRRRQGGAL